MPDDVTRRIHEIGMHRVLNPDLVRRQRLDVAAVDRLKVLHAEIQGLMFRFADAPPEVIPALVLEVQRVEFAMQEAWRFPQDASRHSHWMTMPGCRCPKDVNTALFGQATRFVSDACPVHSTTDKVPGVTLLPYAEGRVSDIPMA